MLCTSSESRVEKGRSCGLAVLHSTLDQWFRLADLHLMLQICCCRLRIFHYYLPVFFWVQNQLQQHKAKHKGQATTPPMVVRGICTVLITC